MKPPLPVIRGKDGIIRDANGRPVIVVFDSKPARSLCNNLVDDADQLQRMQNGPQPLEFISVSGAAKENTEARTLIRTHVMQDYKRRKLMQSARFCKTHEAQQHKNTAHVSSQEDCHPFWTPFPSQPSGSLDPFVSYPVQMQPYMHRLIHHYLTVITPAITEPGWKDFFPLATQDAAFFHAILLRSALHANFLTGNGKALEPVFHKIKAIQLVNEKLQNPTERLSDLMILTVAFLAITECNFADYTAWNLHMNGLSRIIEMRGGLKTLDKSLQYMIYRFDFVGSVETSSSLHFPLPEDLIDKYPIVRAGTSTPYKGFENIASSFSLNSEIVTILSELQRLHTVTTTEMNSCYTPEDITHIIISLRHRLLLCSTTGSVTTQSRILSEACRLGLLIYLRPAINCPFSYRNLLGRLMACLESIKIDMDIRRSEIAELVLWLMFLGGTTAVYGPNRAWFVAQLCDTVTILQIHS